MLIFLLTLIIVCLILILTLFGAGLKKLEEIERILSTNRRELSLIKDGLVELFFIIKREFPHAN